MARTTAEVLLHPIRLRIVMALSGNEMTTSEIGGTLTDVAPATLYRHVAILADAGLIEVVQERQVRGGLERTYRVVDEAARIGPEDAEAMSADEHMAGFVNFVGTLIDSFGRYLKDPASDVSSDGVGYRQTPIWLSRDELEDFVEAVGAAIEPFLAHEPGPGRVRSLLTTILIPDVAASRAG